MRSPSLPLLLATLLALAGFLLAACGDQLDPQDTPTVEAPTAQSVPGPLARKLKAKADAGAAKAPAEIKAVMQKAGADLAASGILDQAKNTGDKAPGFTLKDAMGQSVSLEAVLAKGPVVLTFYRGKW